MPYLEEVTKDFPTVYWRLGETAGTSALDVYNVQPAHGLHARDDVLMEGA